MTIQELNDKKIPIVRIDNSLKKYKEMNLFQDKVDSANEVLRTVGLPPSNTTIKTDRELPAG